MFRILIDTCVWLDLAKDHEQQPTVGVLNELIDEKKISLILPRTVVDEFNRNKARVAEESGRSLSTVFKRVKDAVNRFSEGPGKKAALSKLDEVDHKIPILGEKAFATIAGIERLFTKTPIIETANDVKVLAANRAIEGKAPFHRPRNGINDAILIEIYARCLRDRSNAGTRFAFVTHNTKDFSHPTADNRLPHPDLAGIFSRVRSLYMTNLAETLRRVEPERISDLMIDYESIDSNPRSLNEMLDAIREMEEKVWYDRHHMTLHAIQTGKIKIIPDKAWTPKKHSGTITVSILAGATKAAGRIEKRYGSKNLGPWSHFDWGMLNGKLSALRWVLGEEWDNLDT